MTTRKRRRRRRLGDDDDDDDDDSEDVGMDEDVKNPEELSAGFSSTSASASSRRMAAIRAPTVLECIHPP